MLNLAERKQIANRIKAYRSAKRISQEKMAELLGITYSTYTKIEHGAQNITIKHLIKLCRILNVTADAILFESLDSSGTFNYDEFLLYSDLFSDEQLENAELIIQKIRKLKDVKKGTE
jgi:transcriptional regulator with XRE-family HTH domain